MIRMSPDNTNNAAPQPRVTSFYDERAKRIAADYWSDICSRVTDPEAARILVKYLDENQHLIPENAGIYLAAKETLQRERIRCAKRCRRYGLLGQAVRRSLSFGRGVVDVSLTVVSVVYQAVKPVKPVVLSDVSTTDVQVAAEAVPETVQPTAEPEMVFPTLMEPFPIVHPFKVNTSTVH